MLYIGNFSYNDDTDSKDNFCLMPCVVEAEDADEALAKFADMFEQIRTEGDLLDGAGKIYLDSLAEFEGTPTEPVLVQWQKIVPAVDGLCSITAALPESDEADAATAYSWADQVDGEDVLLDDPDEDELEDAGYVEQPFLEF